jgi:aminoglycoside N3'-acetyltransferase
MQKTTRDNFQAAIFSVLPEKPGIAVIHSSLPDLMPPHDFFPWGALYGLEAIVRRGWTVALPAFTFNFCRGGFFSAKKSPSETGILADGLLRYCPEAVRTPHPIYSFGVLGPRAAEIIACPSSTTFGDDSPFGLFELENATVVMMGCTWAYNTQIHRYEELAAVPYRYPKVFSGTADYGAGPHPVQATMWVRDLAANPINDFSLVERNLRAAGLIVSVPLWRGTIEAAAALDIARICRADLASNPYAYVSNAAAVSEVLAHQRKAAKS